MDTPRTSALFDISKLRQTRGRLDLFERDHYSDHSEQFLEPDSTSTAAPTSLELDVDPAPS